MTPKNIIIKIMVDNKANAGLMKEHGYSTWIEVFGQRILFDTGQGKALIHNSAALECDLSLADALILSHGHYDHTGGVSYILKHNPGIKVYCHSHGLLSRYSNRDVATPKEISIIPCHCTGTEAVAYMQDELGKKVTLGNAGMFLEL